MSRPETNNTDKARLLVSFGGAAQAVTFVASGDSQPDPASGDQGAVTRDAGGPYPFRLKRLQIQLVGAVLDGLTQFGWAIPDSTMMPLAFTALDQA